jgi:hypothetical protein
MYTWQLLDALSVVVPESKRQLAPTAQLCSAFPVFDLPDAQRCPKEGCSSAHSRCELIRVDQNSIVLINQQDAATRYCEICTQTVHLGFGGDKNFAQHEAGKSHQKKLTTQMSSSSAGNMKRQSTFVASFFTKKVPSPGPSSSRRSSHASQPVALTSATPSQSRVPIDVDSIPDNSTNSTPPNAADRLLNRLRVLTSNLPKSVLVAGPEDVFACFAHWCSRRWWLSGGWLR